MSAKCEQCYGKGFHTTQQTCPDCKGTGSKNLILGVGSSNQKNDCQTCKGKGKLFNREQCDTCEGTGKMQNCLVCGNSLEQEGEMLCNACLDNPIIIELSQPLDQKYLDGKRALAAKVIKIDNRGVLLDLGAGFKGTFTPSKQMNPYISQILPIRLLRPINPKDRSGSPIKVNPIELPKFKTVKKHLPVDAMTIEEISQQVGNVGELTCQIIDVFQIPNGPTIYTIIDENGKSIQGTAYTDNNRDPYPKINRKTVAKLIGRFRYYNEQPRIQIYQLEKANAEEALNFMNSLANMNQKNSSTLSDNSFIVSHNIYDELKTKFVDAAKQIRSAVLRGQNIILRYHSPSIDGTLGAYAIDFAIRKFMKTHGAKKEEYRRIIRKLPHRSSVLEISDVSRDLSFALDEGGNNTNLPLYVLIDFGSSNESVPALELCNAYGIESIVIDHNLAGTKIEETATTIINPSLNNHISEITSGMISTELANFVAMENEISKNISHLSSVSYYSNKIKSEIGDAYDKIATENGFNPSLISDIKYSIEYVNFGLRFFDGGEVIRNILHLSGPSLRSEQLVNTISPVAKNKFEESLNQIKDNASEKELKNGDFIFEIDLDKYSKRMNYPSSYDLLFEFHTSSASEKPNPIFTLGITDSYISLSSSREGFSYSDFAESLEKSNKKSGINFTNSHNSISILFYPGHQEAVLKSIKKLLDKL